MCGVTGLLITDPAAEDDLGRLLVSMVTALSERGPDSAGLAYYNRYDRGTGAPVGEDALRLSLGTDDVVVWGDLAAWVDGSFPDASVEIVGSGAVVTVADAASGDFNAALAEVWPTVHQFGTGHQLTVVKDVGPPTAICERNGMAAWRGHLGIAHTRMATESAVTARHAHPFVPGPDLCIVHNGSFSNHASVRRRLRADGVTFDSDNDSEVAARLLAQRIGLGDSLDEATRWIGKEMDGFFTLVIGTGTGMSVVRDAFACKPAVVAVTSAYVAVASEYRALAGLPDIDRADVFEPQPEEVYTWTL